MVIQEEGIYIESKLIDFGFAEEINKFKLVTKAGTPGYIFTK